MTRYKIAIDWVMLVFNDYSFKPNQRENIWWEDLILPYGDEEQQTSAAQNMTGGSLEQLNRLKTTIESETLNELVLDRKYATERLSAAANNTSLSAQLLSDCDWDGLEVLLDHDEKAYHRLINWLSFSARMGPDDMSEIQDSVFERITRLSAIMADPPERSDLPPAYDANDGGRPPAYPHPPPASLTDRIGVDEMLRRFRQTLGWP